MATQLAAPSSQKAGDRPISFLLDDQSTGVTPPQAFVDLVIRPEDLTRTDASRINVQQTLGGAWADNFGAGIPQITITGHTGWRRTQSSSDDGVARFQRLKDQVFDQWHKKRAAATAQGTAPDNVRLVFSDALDNFSVVVAPMTFVLRRSKSRPLLCQYQIAMTVLETDPLGPSLFGSGSVLDAGILQAGGLTSLLSSINKITAFVKNIQNFITGTLLAPMKAFMNMTAQLYGAVRGAISSVSGIAGSLISFAQMTAQAGVNIMRSLAAVAQIPQIIKSQLMAVGSAYSNIFCVMRNALRQQIYFQDYSDVYGASNCSSTAGGRPISSLAGVNPFYNVVPTPSASPLSVTQEAQGAFRMLASADTVLAPMSVGTITTAVSTIAGGFFVA